MDVVLIKPGSQQQVYGELNAFELTALEPPLWAALLAGHLRRQGFSVALLDAEAEGWSHERTAEQVKEIGPLLAVVSVSGSNPSASTMNMSGAGIMLQHLKRIAPGIKTLLHGLHPSALPERTLSEEAVDFVCQGEGFFTLSGLIEGLRAGAAESDAPGLWYRKNGRIRSNPRPPLLKDLDALPMAAWDLLPMHRYRAHNWHCFDDIRRRQPYGVLWTSLGCPYDCTFCCINALFGRPGIRYRSPQRVVDDIAFMVENYGIRNIKIMDELFALKESRVVDICDRIIARGYDLNMWAYARVNTVTPRMLDKMKRAGINWVAYGFESGSRRVLEGVNKRYNPDSVADVVRMTYDAGLYIGANFIFGLPDDDFDSMQDTLALALDINAEWANFNPTMAYPGSRLYQEALDHRWELPDDWYGYSQYAFDSLPLATRHLTAGQVLSFRDYAFRTYFENPRYLDKIKERFGMPTVRHIRGMSRHRIKRKHTQFEALAAKAA